MTEKRKPPRPQVGDIVYSKYFKRYLIISEIISNDEWYCELPGRRFKAQTPLSYFNKSIAVRLWQHD